MKRRIELLSLLLLFCTFAYGQIDDFNYKRPISGISEQWHQLLLPDELFGKLSPDLADMRIFGINANQDTIEVPYLLQVASERVSVKTFPFKLLNVSHNEKGYYFTIEMPATELVNQLKLEFGQENFDWRVQLEGSPNQKEWFTITADYRILSIKNQSTDFQFTNLIFPDSNYRYFRLLINSNEQPKLNIASVEQLETTNGVRKHYPLKRFKITDNKETNQTEIDLELAMPVPVSQLSIHVKKSFDYYRPISIKYLTDSIKTEQGWLLNYRKLQSGVLNSFEQNEFRFNSTIAQRLKVIIDNQDNQPLTIESVQVEGYTHKLLARFSQPASYFLVYGNSAAEKPSYDIAHFTDSIPERLPELTLGDELPTGKHVAQPAEPLFKNKIWLWIILLAIIFILGWFSFNMMRKQD